MAEPKTRLGRFLRNWGNDSIFTGKKAFTPDGDLITDFPATWSTLVQTGAGWGGTYAAIYRAQPSVRTCVDFLARNIAQLGIKVYARYDDDREDLYDHELARLLRRPYLYEAKAGSKMPAQYDGMATKYRLMFGTVADMAIYDVAYWRKVKKGKQYALIRIPPSTVSYEDQTTIRLTNGELLNLSNVVRFRGYCPTDDRWGVSPMETLRRILDEEWAAGRNRERFWRNAARQSGVIERPMDAPEWDDEMRKRFREDWQSATAGEVNSGKTAILEDGMKWNTASFSPRDAEYIASRKLSREEVARAYHIPLPMVGLLDNANFASVDEYHTMLYTETLGPWLELIQEEIEAQLLPEFDDPEYIYVEFNLMDKLKGSFKDEAALLTSAVGGPWMTRDEARVRKNLPKLDGQRTDQLIVPLNVVVGGQPAPNVPTEVPAPEDETVQPPKSGEKLAPHLEERVARREGFVSEFQGGLAAFFERQRRVVKSRAGAGDRRFDSERWNGELKEVLLPLCRAIVRAEGELAAARLQIKFAMDSVTNYLVALAEGKAAGINSTTEVELAGSDDDEIDAVFDSAINERSVALAASSVTQLMAFAAQEAAAQASR